MVETSSERLQREIHGKHTEEQIAPGESSLLLGDKTTTATAMAERTTRTEREAWDDSELGRLTGTVA